MAIIIYSATTGRIRRVIKNSNNENQSNSELLLVHPALTGELHINAADELSIEDYQNEVIVISGITPANDRHAVINSNGDVTGIILACLACNDSIENHTLVAHQKAQINWRQLVNGSFQRSLIEINTDIQTQEEILTRISNRTIFEGLTDAEIIAYVLDITTKANDELTILELEKTARIAPR